MINTANITTTIVKANITVDWTDRVVIVKLAPNVFLGSHFTDNPNDQRIDVLSRIEIFKATNSIFESAEEKEPDHKPPPFPFMMRTDKELQVNPDWQLLFKHLT